MWRPPRLAALTATVVWLAPLFAIAQSGVTSSPKNPLQIATLH
jgi:hypothetical protein